MPKAVRRTHIVQMTLTDEGVTESLAAALAAVARSGDVLALWGDLGTGKTVFARAFIRAATGRRDEEVPSPTFTLVQTYDAGEVPIHHFDMYRLKAPEEVIEQAVSNDDAIDALVSVVGMWRALRAGGLGRYGDEFYADPAVRTEGWIWGLGPDGESLAG